MIASAFDGTAEIVQAVREAPPNMWHVHGLPCPAPGARQPKYSYRTFQGRRVGWVGEGYIVEVDAERVLFMQDNIWNFAHAAGVMNAMKLGDCFEIPAARVYRIAASDVHYTQDLAERGELLEQLGMIRPWTRRDIGTFKAQLVDGNHRAAAAMALGEPSIWVYVGENYRDEVRKKDWR